MRTPTPIRTEPGTTGTRGRVAPLLALLAPLWMAPAAPAHGALQDANPKEQAGQQVEARSEVEDELVEDLARALGMTPDEVEALGLSPAEMRGLLAGFTEETVVVGSRAEARSATESAVPVDVLTATDLVRQGGGDLKDQLRTVIPSFNVNTQPIGGASTVVRPAMLRNLAPDHTLILVNGPPSISRKLLKIIDLAETERHRFPCLFPLSELESAGPSQPSWDPCDPWDWDSWDLGPSDGRMDAIVSGCLGSWA